MRHEKDSNIKDKLNTLLLIKSNKVTEINEIVGLLNRHRNTISSWLNKYRNGGLEKLLFVKKREIFEPALINGNNLEKLKSRLSNPEDFSSYGEIKRMVKNRM
ncbi:MAG: helix-turn-helix domain-containing protein [Candidatus Sericytochromatia bacterium]|nr:helix-turn-helix domain-containing protein [Candidatus Sericytochromatia bacterium]